MVRKPGNQDDEFLRSVDGGDFDQALYVTARDHLTLKDEVNDQDTEQAMTTVFLSGSRKLSRLNEQIRRRVQNITEHSFNIVLGDANGADKALQGYLQSLNYPHVTVFCAGDYCRNNLGSWPTRTIDVPPDLKGRDFYTQKDKVMADEADYGLVLWDGESAGAIENVVELLKRQKKALVYLSPKKTFYTVASASELRSLLSGCDKQNLEKINKKIGLRRSLEALERSAQTEFSL